MTNNFDSSARYILRNHNQLISLSTNEINFLKTVATGIYLTPKQLILFYTIKDKINSSIVTHIKQQVEHFEHINPGQKFNVQDMM